MGAAGNSGSPDRIAILRVDLFGCHPPIWREIEVPMKAVICVTGDVRLEAGGPRSVRHLLRKWPVGKVQEPYLSVTRASKESGRSAA